MSVLSVRFILISLTGLLAAPAYTADSYTIDPQHTWPMFEVNHLGFSTQRGRFDKTSGKVTLDIAAKKGSVDLTIETGSIDMGFEKWNEHLRDGDFFNAVIFPTMRFTSDKFIFDGDKPVAAEGRLTLLSVTKPVTLTISDFKCGSHPMLHKSMCGANVSTTIKRSDFGMIRFIPLVSDEVKIYSPIEAYKD